MTLLRQWIIMNEHSWDWFSLETIIPFACWWLQQRYSEGMKKAGKEVQTLVYEDGIHTFGLLNQVKLAPQMLVDIVNFINAQQWVLPHSKFCGWSDHSYFIQSAPEIQLGVFVNSIVYLQGCCTFYRNVLSSYLPQVRSDSVGRSSLLLLVPITISGALWYTHRRGTLVTPATNYFTCDLFACNCYLCVEMDSPLTCYVDTLLEILQLQVMTVAK